LREAAETYERLENVRASEAAAGLGDLALYEGSFAEAARIFERSASADIAAKDDAAAEKFAALAYTQFIRGQKTSALKAAESALSSGKAAKIRFLAARIFAEAGQLDTARVLAAALSSESEREPQAYAKILEGNIALKNADWPKAITALTAATELLDTWLGRFDLGRAYLQAGRLLEADAEFDRCIKRRGEAMSLFLDEVPTYGYFPLVYYYQGRIREGLKTDAFVESYRAYLRIREKAGEDPILTEVRRRAGL
jgi:tetratricopeptide (TPR) repeat protein